MWRRKARNRMSGKENDVLNFTFISHFCSHRASGDDVGGRVEIIILSYCSFLKSLYNAFFGTVFRWISSSCL